MIRYLRDKPKINFRFEDDFQVLPAGTILQTVHFGDRDEWLDGGVRLPVRFPQQTRRHSPGRVRQEQFLLCVRDADAGAGGDSVWTRLHRL